MKILVIGCGSIGQRHIRNLVSIKAGDMIVFDIDKSKLKEVNAISRSIAVFQDLDMAWEEKPEAVFVTVPTGLHLQYALEAARRGCHLFIEKPVSHDTRGLDKLAGIVERKGLITFVGYNNRYKACVTRVKRLLENNAVGKIIGGKTHFGSYLPERHPWEDYRGGYGARHSLGGGVILDALSHHLDLLIFLFGNPESVFGCSGRKSSLEIDVEDTAEALLKFRGGEVINLHTNFIQRPYKCTLELIGEKGTILCDFIKDVVKYYDVDKRKWVVRYGDRDPNKSYIREVRHFMECLKGKASPMVDLNAGKEELEMLMEIKRSSSVERWVKV